MSKLQPPLEVAVTCSYANCCAPPCLLMLRKGCFVHVEVATVAPGPATHLPLSGGCQQLAAPSAPWGFLHAETPLHTMILCSTTEHTCRSADHLGELITLAINTIIKNEEFSFKTVGKDTERRA